MEVSTKIHSLLTPDNCAVILIDYQPQMAPCCEHLTFDIVKLRS